MANSYVLILGALLVVGSLGAFPTAKNQMTMSASLLQQEEDVDDTVINTAEETIVLSEEDLQGVIDTVEDANFSMQDTEITLVDQDGDETTVSDEDRDDFLDELNEINEDMDEGDVVEVTKYGLDLEYEVYDSDDKKENELENTGTAVGSDKTTDELLDEDAVTIDEYELQKEKDLEYSSEYQDVIRVDASEESREDYVKRVIEDENYDEDVPVFSTNYSEDTMSGDMTDNASSDSMTLTKVAPGDDAQVLTWQEIDNESDDQEFNDDADDSDNPDVRPSGFLQASNDNPLKRDEDTLPSSSDDEGDDYINGETQFVLVTSFIEDQEDTGKVWVVPQDEDERDNTFQLIGGLQKPVGVCFDVNHEFLYVVESGDDTTGYIYQYEIDWSDNKFVLERDIYVVIYEGNSPSDCKVDEYGNLYFTEIVENKINMIGYLDLYAGYKNRHYTLYYSAEDYPISTPVALDVINSEDIYFVNNEDTSNSGLLLATTATTEYINGDEMTVMVRSDFAGWAIAYTESDWIFYAKDNGEVWAANSDDKDDRILKSSDYFQEIRGMCYGDDKIYIADYAVGKVSYITDNDDENEEPEELVHIQAAYALFCVNKA